MKHDITDPMETSENIQSAIQADIWNLRSQKNFNSRMSSQSGRNFHKWTSKIVKKDRKQWWNLGIDHNKCEKWKKETIYKKKFIIIINAYSLNREYPLAPSLKPFL